MDGLAQPRTLRLNKYTEDCMNGKVAQLIKDGARVSDVVNQYGISESTAIRYCQKYKIPYPPEFTSARKQKDEEFKLTPSRKLALCSRW